MSDIKLFRINSQTVQELQGQWVQVERSIQRLIENNLNEFLGIRFLATEYHTDGGRIDTLGIDENGFPVIIEYKRAINENVINQGLSYLNWLVHHKGDFKWLVMEKCGKEVADDVDWTNPRLLCIAGDFSTYDEDAIKEIKRNIELIRYRRYGDELLLLELVNTSSAKPSRGEQPGTNDAETEVSSPLGTQLPQRIQDLYSAVEAYIMALGDVQKKNTQTYIAFRRIKNFACVVIQKNNIYVYVKLNPDEIELEENFTRDMRTIGHFGTGDLEITLRSLPDFERAQPLILASYQAN